MTCCSSVLSLPSTGRKENLTPSCRKKCRYGDQRPLGRRILYVWSSPVVRSSIRMLVGKIECLGVHGVHIGPPLPDFCTTGGPFKRNVDTDMHEARGFIHLVSPKFFPTLLNGHTVFVKADGFGPH